MPKANEVASELRKLADALDREPEAAIYFRAIEKFDRLISVHSHFVSPFTPGPGCNLWRKSTIVRSAASCQENSKVFS